jgi:hypothetical protein
MPVVPSRTFTLVTEAPTIIESVPTSTFTFTPYAPTAVTGQTINVPPTAFDFTPYVPTLLGDDWVEPPSHTFAFQANAPLITSNIILYPPSHTFTFTPYKPKIILTTKLLERSVNVSTTAEVFIILITIRHSTLVNPIRVSNDPTQLLPIALVKGTVSNGEEFIFFPFEFVFPNQEAFASPVAQIRLDNVSREISTIINELPSSPTFDVQVVLASTPDIVELELLDFKLRRVEWNAINVIGDISVEYFDQEPYPSGRFNPSGFPGLYAS